jgi:antitoxin MazE
MLEPCEGKLSRTVLRGEEGRRPLALPGLRKDLTHFTLLAILRISIRGITMVTKIQKWGNSQGLRLAKQILEDAHISVGDDVDVIIRDGLIIVSPARRVRGKRSLQELVSQIPKDYKAEEMDWGEPVGREAW